MGVESITGYKFRDSQILEEALEQTRNKRLALLGDKVVALMIVDSWYRSESSCCKTFIYQGRKKISSDNSA
jgi:ribonuclease III